MSSPVRVQDRVERGQPLFTLHAQSLGELQHALSFVRSQLPVVRIEVRALRTRRPAQAGIVASSIAWSAKRWFCAHSAASIGPEGA